MKIVRKFRFAISYVLRITHIALWLTIPTAFLRWLDLAETPAECVPEYGWYRGNVLCVSEDTFFFIVFGLFLLGFCVIALWIMGFILEGIFRVARGDRRLPPVQWRVILAGWGLLWHSLRYWLPFIAVVLAAHAIRVEAYPRDFTSPVLETLPVIAALVVFWGYLVGLARSVTCGEHSMIWRRRKNIRLALMNIRATLAVSVLLFLVTKLGAIVWSGRYDLSILMVDMDPMIGAALASFAFFFLLLCWSIVCSHIIGRYARKIGHGDNLRTDAKLE